MTEVDYDPFASPELARSVPTTEAQRELWLAAQLGADASMAYNESVSLLLDGALDVPALQNALLALSDRHEALRSTLSADGLSLLVAPRGGLQAELRDLSGQAAGAAADALAAARLHAVSTPFDLVNGPLCRAELVRLSAQRHELILTSHHIVCDGWSFGVVCTELMALYRNIVGGAGGVALGSADSFGDYVLQQSDIAHQQRAEADVRWWVQQYDTSVPVLELPVDRQRSPLRTFASHREDLTLDAELAAAVRKLGGRQGASLFVTLFSAFSALLARLSGQDDVVVGVPAAGQAEGGQQALVGHCVQLLPIRVAVEMEAPFEQLLAATRGRVLDAFEHQACTFGQLLKKLQVPRDPSRLPLVSVLFNLDQDIRSEDLSGAGLTVQTRSNPRLYENFELFLNAAQRGGEIVLECQYNTDLFDRDTIRRWLQLYREAVRAVVADAKRPLVEALAPTQADRELLDRFNRTAMDVPRQQRVDALISRQAAATPAAVAVRAAGTSLGYEQLERRANALAHALRDRGVKAGDLVGLYCGRNEHMVVALLGILKAGAGYIPMDPAFPADRLEYMCTDGGVRHIVSDASVVGSWKFKQAERLAIDELGERADAPPAPTSVDDVAYVIYTSGSTGRPKGVRVPHRTVTNLLASVAREPGMTARNTVLSVTTLSFDIAVSEVVLPLTVGAAIVVADRSQVVDGDALRALIERERVDFIDATPSTWRLLLAAGWQGGRHVKAICTGEPLPPDLGRELLPRVGELWNGYGPTETTVWSTFYRVTAIEGTVPIGHPIANTQIHVVDPALRVLPVGVIGEIFIGGEGVTLGYLGRPDLTDERFLPDPFRPGHRWYKTGDLGRWRADGVLECLGRSDHQVKVRGYRIELGEIESNLARHADVDRCVVVTREDDPGDVRLVAYAVSRGAKLDANALRDYLRQTLPEYMIPAHVMQLDAIPLLPNGKIDRKSLPRPEREARATGPGRAPASPLEAAVLAAFEQVLKLPGLRLDDDFFALGGHSLLAARLTTLLNKELGLAMPLRTIFESPTAEALARAAGAMTNAPRRRAVKHDPQLREAPLTVMQERIRFMEEVHPGRVVYNTPSAHRLRGPLDRARFEAALHAMLQRQPSLRTRIVKGANGPVQRVDDDVVLPLPFEDLSTLDAATREPELMRRLQAIIDTPIPIDQAPLLRCALYRLAENEHVFLFMPHHIVWDGWSFDLLYEEMAALYPAALEDRKASQLPVPVSYLDYALWHRDWMAGDECKAQIQYWKQLFSSSETPQPMPTDRQRGVGMTGIGGVEWVKADKVLTEQLRAAALRSGVTVNMLVMAVYAAMLSRATGTSAIVVGVPVRGRLSTEVESVMGFFNNLLPMPLRVPAAMSLRDWFGTIKRELLNAFANQDVPFERLADEPEIAASAQKAGLYQSLFSFQDARERQRRWGPLEHSSVLVMQKGSTEDLGLWLMEVPGGLEGGLNYNTDLFEAATVRMLVERLLGLLRRVATADPESTLEAVLDAPGADATAFDAWVQARRTAVPAATSAAAPAAADGAGALTETEAKVAGIWAALLGIGADSIGPSDNFFDLGGSSLLFMRALAQMDAEVGLRIDPRRLLSESLRQIAEGGGAVDTPAPAAAPRSDTKSGLFSKFLGRRKGG